MADGSESESTPHWKLCGERFPREEIVYFCQILMLYSVIVVGLVNLTMWWSTDDAAWKQFWIGTVSGGIGYLLPQPRMSKSLQTVAR